MSHVKAGDTVLLLKDAPQRQGTVQRVTDGPTDQVALVLLADGQEIEVSCFYVAVLARKDGSRVLQGLKELPYRQTHPSPV